MMSSAVPSVLYSTMCYTIGFLSLGCGVAGMVLPVLPTTIFLIIAVFFFERANPRLSSWLLHHPRYGKTLKAWKEHRSLTAASKRVAASGMVLGILLFAVCRPPIWVFLLGTIFILLSLWYVLSRPTLEPSHV